MNDIPIYCEEYIVALLREIALKLKIKIENILQTHYDSPFENTGNHFENDTFKVKAYSWNGERNEWNFMYKDVIISWYKYLGRGTCINHPISRDEAINMFNDCMSSLDNIDTTNLSASEHPYYYMVFADVKFKSGTVVNLSYQVNKFTTMKEAKEYFQKDIIQQAQLNNSLIDDEIISIDGEISFGKNILGVDYYLDSDEFHDQDLLS